MSRDEVVRAQTLAHGVQQHLVQVGAMDGKMRPLMPGGEPPGLAIDELAVAGEEGIVLRLAGDRRERVLQPERAQLFDRMRSEIDPDPERADVRRRLEDPNPARHVSGMGSQRQRQPADASADDDQIHAPLRINASQRFPGEAHRRKRVERNNADIAHSAGTMEPPRWGAKRE